MVAVAGEPYGCGGTGDACADDDDVEGSHRLCYRVENWTYEETGYEIVSSQLKWNATRFKYQSTALPQPDIYVDIRNLCSWPCGQEGSAGERNPPSDEEKEMRLRR